MSKAEKFFTADMVAPLRAQLDMTQQEFAEACECGKRTVARLESGKQQNISRAIRVNMQNLAKQVQS